MSSSKIKIFIVDDHPLMRQALKTSILTEVDMEVVGTGADGVEAVEKIPLLKPDIAIMDLMMPNMGGFAAIRSLSQSCPEIPVLALSSLEREESIFEAVQAGARGYLTKDVEHDELVSAIRTVSKGKSYLPTYILDKLMGGVRQDLVKDKPFDRLTKREKEVLALMGEGCSNKEISAKLVITEATVRVHFHQVMRKMGFENRREAVVFAVKDGMEK